MTSGTNILVKNKTAEIQNISPFGFWIFDGETEFFVSFKDYPQFLSCSINQITNFTVDLCGNFHWEALDIDIEQDALVKPEDYPLIYKA